MIGLTAAVFDRRSAPSPQPSLSSPAILPPQHWWDAATRAWQEFNRDQIPAVAAGVTFFGLLAAFPAIGAFVSLYGLVADVGDARRQLEGLTGVLPSGAISVIGDQIDHIVQTKHSRLGLTLVFSLALSIWSSNAGVKALMAGLNIAYEAKERRNFFVLNAVSLAFTLGAVLAGMLSLMAVSLGPELLGRFGFQGLQWAAILRWPLLLLFVGGFVSLLYRFGAFRPHAHWRWISPGTVVGSLGWLLMSLIFSWYVAHFGNYDRTYGSLGAVVGFMTWIWLSIIVILFGAELNAEIEAEASAPAARNRV